MTNPLKTPLKPELFRLASAAVCEGVIALRGILGTKLLLYIPRQWGWRAVEMRENGMPSFRRDEESAPLDYSYLFGRASHSQIDENKISSFKLLVDHLVADREYQDTLRYRYRPDISEEDLIEMVRSRTEGIPATFVEQYQTVYPVQEFEPERFLPLYLRWEEEVFADSVPIDIVVPLLMVRADFREYRLGPSVAIRRMDEAFQRARAARLDSAHHVHEWAAQAATHAIVVEGRALSRAQRHGLTGYPWELEDLDIYPVPLIDKAVAALRVATGFVTGYAQVLIHYRYRDFEHADSFLPSLHGVPVRRYPVSFDHWGWLRPTPVISDSHAQLAASFFGPLSRIPESNGLAVAARRVNDCYLRNRTDDALIDAVIALETLLSDEDHQELTHKLALRVAALLKLEPNFPKQRLEAFREIKLIYKYRSKIVHGKSRDANKLVAKHFGGDENGPLVAALDYLRVVMRLLLLNERYRDPAEIDRHLLLGGNETEGP